MTTAARPSSRLLARLNPGDLVLLGARPGHGKTLKSLEIILEAMKAGRRGVFFTLEYNEKEFRERFHTIGGDTALFKNLLEFDDSDAISAGYITARLASAPRGTSDRDDGLMIMQLSTCTG